MCNSSICGLEANQRTGELNEGEMIFGGTLPPCGFRRIVNARITARAERAEALVEVQKKVAMLLGTPFESEKS